MESRLLAGAGVIVILTIASAAHAGGFALREQSAYGQGSSYAGVAVGGSLSSMFWNPATMTQFSGIHSESVITGIIPSSKNTATSGTTVGTSNIGNAALVPAGYYSWQVQRQLWLGLSVTSPYGLSESFPDTWAGRNYSAGGSHLNTYNATPSFAYAVNDWLSIGAGVQFQYADATLTKGLALGATNQAAISGTGWGYGFTAGLTVTPTPTTTIGLGYRSAVNQKINGTLAIPNNAFLFSPFSVSTPGSVTTTLNLPDTVSLGLRQKLSSQWTAMATVEWSNWSRIGTSQILQANGAQALVGSSPVAVAFEYSDGWFYSLGAEYQWNDRLALRGGVGYEKSPITDDVRVPLLSDNDRVWLSAGATYKYSKNISIDAAYSHLFVKSTPIDVIPGNPSYSTGTGVYTGTVDSHIDIVSLALKIRWDDPAPTPIKQRYVK
jgi:long-chain fatty acid transport protein